MLGQLEGQCPEIPPPPCFDQEYVGPFQLGPAEYYIRQWPQHFVSWRLVQNQVFSTRRLVELTFLDFALGRIDVSWRCVQKNQRFWQTQCFLNGFQQNRLTYVTQELLVESPFLDLAFDRTDFSCASMFGIILTRHLSDDLNKQLKAHSKVLVFFASGVDSEGFFVSISCQGNIQKFNKYSLFLFKNLPFRSEPAPRFVRYVLTVPIS